MVLKASSWVRARVVQHGVVCLLRDEGGRQVLGFLDKAETQQIAKGYLRMQIATRSIHVLRTVMLALLVATFVAGDCQSTNPAASAAAPAIQLKAYTASDQSASAGVPSGWKVTNGGQTMIQMTGPQGEAVSLGATVVAQNGAFQADQKAANGIDLSMPYSATLAQKLTMMLEHSAAVAGKPVPQLTIDSATQLPLPATVGQCGRFVGDLTGQQEALKLLAVFCSLPLDSGGKYKNIMLLAQAPAATAAQTAPIAQAIFQSYRIPTTWLQKKLAPFTAPPQLATGMVSRSTVVGMVGADNSANCFDLSVLRETPTRDLPRSCGGTKPD